MATQPPSRLDATLTRVDYDLRLDGAVATGRASLTVDVLKDGWVRAPVPAGLLVSGANVEDQPVSLVPATAGSPQMSAVLSKKGRTVLVLGIRPPCQLGGEQRLAFPTSGAGITRASLTLPRRDAEVGVTGGTGSRDIAYELGRVARGNQALTFTVRKKKTEQRRAELPLRMRRSLRRCSA